MKTGEIQAFDHFEPADSSRSTGPIGEVYADDYDALMIPGGVGNPDLLRGDEHMVTVHARLLRVRASRSPSSATARGCSSRPGSCAGARSPRGRRSETDIRNAGGNWVDRGGRRRRRARHEPQAGRHPGVQREDDRGVREGRTPREGGRRSLKWAVSFAEGRAREGTSHDRARSHRTVPSRRRAEGRPGAGGETASAGRLDRGRRDNRARLRRRVRARGAL